MRLLVTRDRHMKLQRRSGAGEHTGVRTCTGKRTWGLEDLGCGGLEDLGCGGLEDLGCGGLEELRSGGLEER
ncbi:Down syndrome cell adhesion molecule-like protein 1 like [Dissostichus eleginoides]|uniref:Down syndrome cell adhesion molecule-like protein 1 like n=1 Tax=Dissostichus eleginoides TaxID=100907 RepID=A0AAD9EP31_DISEL|nr:Down syndrome cell adhesion molecule-like protein 1 like [Dissostichus eleginoides]